MDGRSICGAIGALGGLALAGCLGDDEEGHEPASTDPERLSDPDWTEDELREEEDDACADLEHDIAVGLPPEVPDDATVVDAAATGLTEIDGAAAALSEASDAYTEEMEGNDGHVWLADGRDEGELYDELGSSVGYVEYEGVTYMVETYRTDRC